MPEPDDEFDVDLDSRIAELESALPLITRSESVLVGLCVELIELLQQRAVRDDDDASLDSAVRVADRALSLLPSESPPRFAVLVERARTWELRHLLFRDLQFLDTAVAEWRALTDDPVAPSPDASAEANAHLGYLLRMRYERLVEHGATPTATAGALAAALETLQRAADELPTGSPALAETHWLLALCLRNRYDVEQDGRDLDRAIVAGRRAVELADDECSPRAATTLARALHERAARRWQESGAAARDCQDDLRSALEVVRAAVDSPLLDDTQRWEVLWAAVTIGVSALELPVDGVDLDRLVSWTSQLHAHCREIDPEFATDEAKAAIVLHGRVLFATVGNDTHAVTDEMMALMRDLVPLTAAVLDDDHRFLVPNFADHPRVALLLRPDLLGARIDDQVRAVRTMPPGPGRAYAGGVLVARWFALHQRGLVPIDYPLAVELVSQALDAPPDHRTWQEQMRLLLANLLTISADTDTDTAQRAIDLIGEIQSTDPIDRRQADIVLVTALQARAVATREISDIEAALALARRVHSDLPPRDEMSATLQITIGTLLTLLGQARADPASIRAGVEALRRCVAELPENDSRRAVASTNLAAAEAWLLPTGIATPDDFQKSLADAEKASVMAPELRWRHELMRLVSRAHLLGESTIDSLITDLREQVASTAADSAEGLWLQIALGSGLVSRAMAQRSPDDALEAAQHLEPLWRRLENSMRHRLWGDTALWLGRAYRLQAELGSATGDKTQTRARGRRLGLLALRGQAWLTLVQSNTDNAMAAARDAAGVAVEVASWAVQDGAAADAVTALDAGRGLILHAASVRPDLDRQHTEPTALAADSRGRRLWALLGASADSASAAHLLDPPLIGDIQRALRRAGAHALVYLVGGSAEIRPVAVFVPERGNPSIVDLPTVGLRPPDFAEALERNDVRYGGDRTAGRDAAVAGSTPAQPPSLRTALPALTHWAWQAVMGRVLGHCATLGLPRPYRLVLVPMGPLATIPWHAARSPDGRFALQDAVFSYAASARLMCDVVARTRIAEDGDALIVGNPTGDLRHAGLEALTIHRQFYPHGHYLADTDSPRPARRQELLDWLAGSVETARGVLHLACHGVVELNAANSSRLLLAGQETLSAEDLVGNAHGAAGVCQLGLVCLAACSTGAASRGYDEAFSLATAFQVAGARSVVSSLWRVPDEATSLLMYMFHHYLVEDRLGPAQALRLAQLWMIGQDAGRLPPSMPDIIRAQQRRLDPGDISAWAGFVHLGQW